MKKFLKQSIAVFLAASLFFQVSGRQAAAFSFAAEAGEPSGAAPLAQEEQEEKTAEEENKEEEKAVEEENTEEEKAAEEANTEEEAIKAETEDPVEEDDPERKERPEEEAAKEQYHFQDGDAKSVRSWMELYFPGGFQDIRQRDASWWGNLYEYERELAEFIQNSLVELDENLYSGQELDEIISVLESGVRPEDFFAGTVFDVLELEDLYLFRQEGWTLDRVFSALTGDIPGGIQAYSAGSGSLESGDRVAGLSVTSTGYSGTGHGTIYKLTLGGQPALCMSCGRAARSGYKYFAGDGEYERRTNGIGYLLNYASLSGKYYAVVQIAAWLYLESKSYGKNQVVNRAASMLNTSSEEASDMAQLVWSYYQGACNHSVSYYVFRCSNGNAQVTAVTNMPSTVIYSGGGGDEGEEEDIEPEFATVGESVSVSYTVQVRKNDWQTGVGLEGCVFDVYENGNRLTDIATGADGTASYTVTKSDYFSADYCVNYGELTPEQQADVTGCVSEAEARAQVEAQKSAFTGTKYAYSIREKKAPAGYVWQANELSQPIAGNETAAFTCANERTLGVVELVKYDTETESDAVQGEGTLEGAVYGIYAAEDIFHQDQKTGLLYHKDELVAEARIGQSPKRNREGYILNTDGSRHAARPGGAIAWEETPGRTLFGDLELGSYYIREKAPSEGYMRDEASYPVTFTYKNQMVKLETRNETAGEAENELTIDDKSSSHMVYSGDYVIKQGIRFIKTSDNTWQTELKPIRGAGFSVYLIRDLSGVKDGSLTPLGDTWSADDIMSFYEYDFTGEPTAVVYKRADREEWTRGDRLWLSETGEENRYRVAEMFTDEDGCVETPELPYGTYVVVETATPENHVTARPFIVHVTQDGGVLYTDGTKQAVEKTYTPEEGIRYGDRKGTKDREGRTAQKQRIVNNTITKAFLRVVKADTEFVIQPGAYIKAEEAVRGTVLKEGARYRLRCLSMDLSRESLKALNWKYDAKGYMSYYVPADKAVAGTLERPFATSFLKQGGSIRDCYITLPQELPAGTYELEELTAPEGYVQNGEEQILKDTGTGRVNGYTLVNTPAEKTVFTVNNGSVYPDGQMGTNKYALRDAYGNLTVTVLQKNQEQKGILEICKHGEQAAGRGPDGVFFYKDAPVEGAEFTVFAAEDIYTQELDQKLFSQYQAKKEDYLLYRKGETVGRITTDRNGWGYLGGLPIGTYRVAETVAGDGFVRNREEKEFEIAPQEQTVSFDIQGMEYQNERQRLKVRVEKKDAESGKPLAGAVYGLYAAQDLVTDLEYHEETGTWRIGDTPKILAAKDTQVAVCETDESGRAVFDADLPLGEYYIRELQAPAGYLASSEEAPVDASYTGEKGGQAVRVQIHTAEFQNQPVKILISKRAQKDGQELPGAVLAVCGCSADGDGFCMTGEIETWVSEGRPREIRGLELEQSYLLREKEAPFGYGYAEDMVFKVTQGKDPQTGKWLEDPQLYCWTEGEWKRCGDDILVMLDDKRMLTVEKSTISLTQAGDEYRNTVDCVRNDTEESLDLFTLTDTLPDQVRLTELWTGTYNQKLSYCVEYRIAGSSDWILWAKELDSRENHHLTVPGYLDTETKHICAFRICFGTVGGRFEQEVCPSYLVRTGMGARGRMANKIELSAEADGKAYLDRAETVTGIFFRSIHGYGAALQAEPAYEIIENGSSGQEGEPRILSERITRSRTGNGTAWPEEGESPLTAAPGSVRTGDRSAPAFWMLAAFAALAVLAGIAGSLYRRRRTEEE